MVVKSLGIYSPYLIVDILHGSKLLSYLRFQQYQVHRYSFSDLNHL